MGNNILLKIAIKHGVTLTFLYKLLTGEKYTHRVKLIEDLVVYSHSALELEKNPFDFVNPKYVELYKHFLSWEHIPKNRAGRVFPVNRPLGRPGLS
jgi:hypothetical protein